MPTDATVSASTPIELVEEVYARLPERMLLELWRRAGIRDVARRRMSFGAGLVVWGRRT